MTRETVIILVIYAAGYCVWLGYTINRFCSDPDDEMAGAQAVLALLWPVCVLIYVPYRFWKALGVKWEA